MTTSEIKEKTIHLNTCDFPIDGLEKLKDCLASTTIYFCENCLLKFKSLSLGTKKRGLVTTFEFSTLDNSWFVTNNTPANLLVKVRIYKEKGAKSKTLCILESLKADDFIYKRPLIEDTTLKVVIKTKISA